MKNIKDRLVFTRVYRGASRFDPFPIRFECPNTVVSNGATGNLDGELLGFI